MPVMFMENCSVYQKVKSDQCHHMLGRTVPQDLLCLLPQCRGAHSYLRKVLLLLLNSYLVLPSEDNVLGESNPTRVKWQPWQPGVAPTTSVIVSSGSHTVGSPFLSPVWSELEPRCARRPQGVYLQEPPPLSLSVVCISNEAYSLVSSEGTTCLDPAPSYYPL